MYWMSKNCVPIITQNLFVIGNDALHHQTVYGLDGDYVLLTNPIERVHVANLYNYVSTPGYMIIPEDHVTSRTVSQEDVAYLSQTDPWRQFLVADQVVRVHEKRIMQSQAVIQNMQRVMRGPSCYSGVTIPWGGLTGVTLCTMDGTVMAELELMYHLYESVADMPIYDTRSSVINMPLMCVC